MAVGNLDAIKERLAALDGIYVAPTGNRRIEALALEVIRKQRVGEAVSGDDEQDMEAMFCQLDEEI